MPKLLTMKEYTYHIGLRLRIYPSDRQKKMIRRNAGASRYVYNSLVAIDRERHRLRKTAHLCPSDRARLAWLDEARSSTTALCVGIPFLAEPDIDANMIAQAKASYVCAWKNCKADHKGRPAFHKKSNFLSYRTSNNYKSRINVETNESLIGLYRGAVYFIDKYHINLPKLGHIRYRGSRKLIDQLLARTDETRIGSVTVEMDETGDCYISLSLASDAPFYAPYPETHKAVGMDMNLTNFLYDSDGEEIKSPRFLKQSEKKIRKAQRKLSRKAERAKKDGRKIHECRNYEEQRIKLARLHKHVARQRLDFIRRLADGEVKTHDYLFAEDLKVRNLLKNHRLAKVISDSGWRLFLTEIQHCAEKRGKICVLINPRNTTQTCSSCGYVCHGDTRITLGVEEWNCPQCGTHHIRDLNAAVNIRDAGLELLKEAGVPVTIDNNL